MTKPAAECLQFRQGLCSPANQIELAERLEKCALPEKSCLGAAASAYQSQQWFRAAQKNTLALSLQSEHCGLDWVQDHGRLEFERTVALSVPAANLKRLGTILRDKQRKTLARQQRLRAA